MNIIFFYFKTRPELCRHFGRLGEFYENPDLKGKHNTLQEIIKWSKEKLKIDYINYWDGFNIKDIVIKDFLKIYKDLSPEEKYIIKSIKHMKGKYDVIAGIDYLTLAHEISHSLFYVDAYYRRKMLNIISKYPVSKIGKDLMKKMGYCKEHIKDEIIAYLVDGGADLKAEGIDMSPYKEVMLKVEQFYIQYIVKFLNIKTVEMKK